MLYVQIPFVRPCIGFLRGGPISEGPQKTELIFAAYSIRHDDAAFLGQVPVPLVLGCYPYSIFLRIACLLHRIIRLFRRHETRFNVFFVCLTDLTCTQFYILWPSSDDRTQRPIYGKSCFYLESISDLYVHYVD